MTWARSAGFAGAMRVGVCAAVAAVALVGAGCTAGPEPAPGGESAGVLVPGRPGEEAKEVPAARADEHRQEVPHNEADVRFLTMMIPHHRQAITMTDMVEGRVNDPRVRAIAERIAVAQDGEIALMEGWLAEHGEPVPAEEHGSHGHHEHGASELMPGMATPEQLSALRAASGPEFDRMFLDLMITHHEGALTMAEEVLAHGVNVRVQQLAQDVVTGQSAEIDRMRAVRG
ncbi:Uncharacterized conserved protein, DUF305 family [Amycolatopsis arida]|uniref:Uncharacterized conserved protein, DUF305 family n=1 Tax=Amycolatopsis arida TaxID=587909 RepID=A0A1I5ULT3_9PSEU|nr:uncharacterized protein (DUF305 family) [Amycolatopsis arida]SFP96148.1 Uncharacterized conserved protein, DUF305 family [Amycolatopsis arida]